MATELKAVTVYASADEAHALELLAERDNRTVSQYGRLLFQAHIASALAQERLTTPSRKEPS